MTEEEIRRSISRAINGDKDAFEMIYLHTRDDVYRTVSFLLSNRDDVHDVVNEIYIGLWKSLAQYDQTRPFRSWLHGLIIRQVQDWRRKIWRRWRLSNRHKEMGLEEKDSAAQLDMETRDELITAIHHLPYKLRVVIILRYFHEYSVEETASLLNIPVGTVKSRHHLAVKELRKKYDQERMRSDYVL
ncbi:sigma-70 family RNA polymerase sigma factor [Bacillus songklensis]|uniref:Sigma-70 family RNA polymerase sigma factor n=1 Tax=Bacillus songklensis TaxID=1069116 RepID=A0ABV8B879_9BACI